MVSKTFLAATALTLASTAHGYISEMFVPLQGKVGGQVTVQIETAIYVQNFVNFGIIWGYDTNDENSITANCDQCVGNYLGYSSLIDVSTPSSGNFTVDITLPGSDSIPTGDYFLLAALPNLVGASGSISYGVKKFNITLS